MVVALLEPMVKIRVLFFGKGTFFSVKKNFWEVKKNFFKLMASEVGIL